MGLFSENTKLGSSPKPHSHHLSVWGIWVLAHHPKRGGPSPLTPKAPPAQHPQCHCGSRQDGAGGTQRLGACGLTLLERVTGTRGGGDGQLLLSMVAVVAESPRRHGWAAGRERRSGSRQSCGEEPGVSPHRELPRLPRRVD